MHDRETAARGGWLAPPTPTRCVRRRIILGRMCMRSGATRSMSGPCASRPRRVLWSPTSAPSKSGALRSGSSHLIRCTSPGRTSARVETRPGVHQHLGALREQDIAERNGIQVTGAARTCLDTMSLVDVERGLVVVNDALNKRLVTAEDLAECAAFMDKWLGSLRHRVVLRLADGRIESVGESRFFYLCWANGLPLPIPQYKIYDDTGRLVAVVDFAWPDSVCLWSSTARSSTRRRIVTARRSSTWYSARRGAKSSSVGSPTGAASASSGLTSTSRSRPQRPCRASAAISQSLTELSARPTESRLLQGPLRFCTETSL